MTISIVLFGYYLGFEISEFYHPLSRFYYLKYTTSEEFFGRLFKTKTFLFGILFFEVSFDFGKER